jgi:hypothetical protein
MAGLPSDEELGLLSLRALAAYAARCARRVRPLFRLRGPAEPWRDFKIDRAIDLAELHAAGRMPLEVGDAANDAADVARSVSAPDVDYFQNPSARAALAAAYAVQVVRLADLVPDLPPDRYSAFAAARESIAAAGLRGAGDAATRAARRDFDALLGHGGGRPAGLGEPINPGEDGPLGPLWPEGAPDW